MSYVETDIEDRKKSVSEVSFLNDDFGRMKFELSSTEEEVTANDRRHMTMLLFRGSLI